VRCKGKWYYWHIMGISVQTFKSLGGSADFYVLLFGVVYVACDYAMDPTKKHKFWEILRNTWTKVVAMSRQVFGVETMSHARVFHWHAWFRADQKRWDRWKTAKSMLFYMKRIVHKEFVLAHQTVNSAYYCDVLWRLHGNMWRISPELWRPYFSLFPRLHIKLKGRHLDTTEVIEAESQEVLNTLTERDFQMHLENCRSCWNVMRGTGLLQGWWWPMGPTLVSDHSAAPVPEIFKFKCLDCWCSVSYRCFGMICCTEPVLTEVLVYMHMHKTCDMCNVN
jgi:hypothetical protein